MASPENVIRLRVRYSETDQMGTYYNSRVLEWFECGRTEYLRGLGLPYAEMEKRGVFLPMVEAHIEYLGRARYDDELAVTTTTLWSGKVRLRFLEQIVRVADGATIARGYTVHAVADVTGRPIRPPVWFLQALR